MLVRLIMHEHLLVLLDNTCAKYTAFFTSFHEPELAALSDTFLTQTATAS